MSRPATKLYILGNFLTAALKSNNVIKYKFQSNPLGRGENLHNPAKPPVLERPGAAEYNKNVLLGLKMATSSFKSRGCYWNGGAESAPPPTGCGGAWGSVGKRAVAPSLPAVPVPALPRLCHGTTTPFHTCWPRDGLQAACLLWSPTACPEGGPLPWPSRESQH